MKARKQSLRLAVSHGATELGGKPKSIAMQFLGENLGARVFRPSNARQTVQRSDSIQNVGQRIRLLSGGQL